MSEQHTFTITLDAGEMQKLEAITADHNAWRRAQQAASGDEWPEHSCAVVLRDLITLWLYKEHTFVTSLQSIRTDGRR